MSRGLVVGLDIAGNTGITDGYVGDAIPNIISKKFRLESDDIEDAYGRAIVYFATRWAEPTFKPSAVYVEGVVPENFLAARGVSNHNSNMIRIGLYGAIVGLARAKHIPVFAVSIAKVRTHFLGRGHKLKGKEAKQAVFEQCKRLGWDAPDLDGSDSAAIWNYGVADQMVLRLGK